MNIDEYKKAEKRSFEDYKTSELRKTLNEPNEWLAHKWGLKDGYQLGKAQPVNELVNKRLQVAAMAMQGLLANGIVNSEFIAKRAVTVADALLTELNSENNG